MADNVFFEDRIKHALHGTFDFFDYVVNDVVQAHIHFFLFCSGFGLRVRTHVEADNNRIGCCGKRNIGFRNGTGTAVDNFYAHAFDFDLSQGAFQRLN
ncbi:hypothetical protein D3C75_1078830 [compost metagenome]